MKNEKTDDLTNMCWIAGIIRTIKVEKGRAFLLVDVGGESRFLRCTVWEDEQLEKILSNFRVDDFIRIVGWLCGWSQKKDGAWVNGVDVRITAVRNNPPARREVQKQIATQVQKVSGRQQVEEKSDETIPF